MEKVIPLGDKGQLVISEAGGQAKLVLSAQLAAGGGDVAGFAKAVVSVEVDLDGKVLIDAGIGVAKIKFPQLASILDGAQAAIDAELAKI